MRERVFGLTLDREKINQNKPTYWNNASSQKIIDEFRKNMADYGYVEVDVPECVAEAIRNAEDVAEQAYAFMDSVKK